MRDPASLNKPSTRDDRRRQHDRQHSRHRRALGPGVRPGRCVRVLRPDRITPCSASRARVAGGNIRAAQIVGLGVGKLILTICFLAGGAAPAWPAWSKSPRCRAAPTPTLAAGYGYTGILVAFLARHNPLAIIPVAILLGGISASGGLLQRRLGLPDASVLVLQGIVFVFVLASDALYGRIGFLKAKILTWRMDRLGLLDRSARRARRRHPRLARRSCS